MDAFSERWTDIDRERGREAGSHRERLREGETEIERQRGRQRRRETE